MAYSEKEIDSIFNSIIEHIENGNSLISILRSENMPSTSTFYLWIDNDEEKSKRYARACEMRADLIFDEMIEISDTPIEGVVIETDDSGRTKEKKGDMLGHRRLQIDARKWILSKMNPKKYGDKIDQNINHSGEIKTNKIDLSKLTEQELRAYAELQSKLERN